MARKPLWREAYLMSLLNFKSLEELEKWLKDPASPDLGARVEPAWDYHAAREQLAREEDVLREIDEHMLSPKGAEYRPSPKKKA